MIIIGIDPGAAGGIAWNDHRGVQAIKMPGSERAVVDALREIFTKAGGQQIGVFMELVGGYIKPAKDDEERENRQPGHTMFTFGRGVGVITGCLFGMGFTPDEVHPATWQKSLFMGKQLKGKPQGERKRILKAAAQRFYPQIKVTLSTADALLIRRYGEMVMGSPFNKNLAKPFDDLKAAVAEKHADLF